MILTGVVRRECVYLPNIYISRNEIFDAKVMDLIADTSITSFTLILKPLWRSPVPNMHWEIFR